MRKPNLFIIGAPKCGTTALSEYLREHPAVFVTQPKESHFFSKDFPYYYSPGHATLDHYLRLYEDAGPEHLAVCEASVWYLYSEVAAEEIIGFAPDARIIVMVRNPVEMMPSLHSQMLFVQDEDQPDPKVAWDLQAVRREGRSIPATCRVPAFLQYGDACSLGAQVERLFATVPREQVKVIVFDDFRRDPLGVWREVLAFAGLPDDGRTEFPVVNANKRHRNAVIARFSQRPPAPLVAASRLLKRLTGRSRLGVLRWLKDRNRAVGERTAISPEFTRELSDHFRDDVALLGRLLDRDLSAWVS